jgi:hypothetical protein
MGAKITRILPRYAYPQDSIMSVPPQQGCDYERLGQATRLGNIPACCGNKLRDPLNRNGPDIYFSLSPDF